MIVLDETYKFVEVITADNRLVKLPRYLEQLFHDEDSPFRSFMWHVEPPCKVRIKIEVETNTE